MTNARCLMGALLCASLPVLAPPPAEGQWLDLDIPERPAMDEAGIEAGRLVYEAHCWFCHGDDGDGEGPVAEYLWPRPRDFTTGSYKLRTTESGELPTDEDLYRTISLGIPGTAMPEWASVLAPEERWQIVGYIKTFAADLFEDEAFDPYEYVVEVGEPPTASRDSLIARGDRVFDEADCWECHGEQARGDGERAAELEDDWLFPILPADLYLGWRYKGGRTPREIYLRLSTGLDGTPMPSYSETATDEERWQMAYFVASLLDGSSSDGSTEAVILAERVEGDLPGSPDDPGWEGVSEVQLSLTGQATFAPRWQIPAVSDISVRAVYNAEEVALRLAWNDRFADTLPSDPARAVAEGWTADDTYPPIYPGGQRVRGSFVDAVEIMFPGRYDGGPVLPHLVYGSAGQPVELVRWRADLDQASGDPVANAAVELRASGVASPPEEQPAEERRASATGTWHGGRWTVVIRRPLAGDDRSMTLRPGRSIPIAFHVWEGANGETGLRMALSSWYYLYLSEPLTARAYLWVLLVVMGVGAAEWWLARWVRARGDRGQLQDYGIEPAASPTAGRKAGLA